MRFVVWMVLAGLMAGSAMAQEKAAPPQGQNSGTKASSVAVPEPKAEDVKSPEAIVAALYDVISGPAEKQRDWERFKSLFAEGARLIPIVTDKEGKTETRVLTPEGYVERSAPLMAKGGWYEKEITHRTERYGHLVQVWSTYAGGPDAAKPEVRGINSIQLMCEERCWILTVLWQAETKDNPLPAEYLPE